MALYPTKLSVFILGFSIGIIFGLVFIVSNNKFKSRKSEFSNYSIYYVDDHKFQYKKWLSTTGYSRHNVNFDQFQYSGNKSLGDYLENKLLKTKINILCVVFLKNVDNAYASIDTWLKQCNNMRFYSMKPDKYYIEVAVIRAKNSWHYLCEVLRHLHKNSSDFMWALFVPDDVFAIPDNLRYYVFDKNFLEPHYLGHRARFWNEHFNLAQAGFVLSKGSIQNLVKRFPSSESCEISGRYWRNEDFYLGKYLSELGITPTDTRDNLGRGRFHLFNPAQLLAPGNDDIFKKYWKSSEDAIVQGSQCCSPNSISFQGTSKDLINFYYYLLYRLKVHPIPGMLGNKKSSNYIASDKIKQKWLFTVDNFLSLRSTLEVAKGLKRLYFEDNFLSPKSQESFRFSLRTTLQRNIVITKVWKQFVLDELGPNANMSAVSTEEYFKLWTNKIESPSIFNSKLRTLLLGDSNNID